METTAVVYLMSVPPRAVLVSSLDLERTARMLCAAHDRGLPAFAATVRVDSVTLHRIDEHGRDMPATAAELDAQLDLLVGGEASRALREAQHAATALDRHLLGTTHRGLQERVLWQRVVLALRRATEAREGIL